MGYWDVVSSIGSIGSAIMASGALAITGLPKFKAWCRKEQKRIRLNRFFHNKTGSNIGNRYKEEVKKIELSNYQISHGKYVDKFELRFYKYQNVFYNENELAKLNGVSLKVGYHFYEIISDYCIRLDFTDDDSGETKSAFIYYGNNLHTSSIDHSNINMEYEKDSGAKTNDINIISFKKITSWKYE